MQSKRAVAILDVWLGWARRLGTPGFTKFYQQIQHRSGIDASVTTRLSNGDHLKRQHQTPAPGSRMAYGPDQPMNLLAVDMSMHLLDCGDPDPGRNRRTETTGEPVFFGVA